MLYLICGLPGTGKTKVANELASLTGGVHLRTDEIRRQIFSDPAYTPGEKERVYEAMFRTAGSVLKTGTDVILDATFYNREKREEAKKLAKMAGTEMVVIEVVCDEKTAEDRLRKRKGDASDADFEVYRKVKSEWEPVKEKHFVIFTDRQKSRDELRKILCKLQAPK